MAIGRCVQLLAELNQSIESGFLSPEDQQRVKGIYSNPDLSSSERDRRALNICIDARLGLLSQEDASAVRQALETYKVSESKGTFTGWELSFGGAQFLEVSVPKDYTGGVLEHYILMHELEHVIQSVVRNKRDARGFLHRVHSDMWNAQRIIFEREEGAMRAEWEYLNSIPETVRRELAEELRQDENIPKAVSDFEIHTLLSSSQTRDQYLKAMRARGRYSRLNVALTLLPVQIGFFATEGLTGAFLVLSATSSTCIGLLKRPGFNHKKSKFFTTICMKLAPVTHEMDRLGIPH